MNENSSSRKPSEKVRQFLVKKGNIGELTPGTRLPTAEELAALLNVSAGTVKNVYRALSQEGRVKTQVGVGSFWMESPGTAPKSYRIGFVMVGNGLPVSDDWWTRNRWSGDIFGGILKRKLECGLNLSLELCEARENQQEEGGFDAMIDLTLRPNRPESNNGDGRIERGRLPLVVHLNPPYDQACVNFVSPDYFVCSRVLGEAWRQTGRRRILYVTTGPLDNSVSSRVRYSGLLCGLGEAIGEGVEVKIFHARNSGVDGGMGIAGMMEETGWIPDAVYCGGDILARGVVQALSARGLSIPDEVSVVGGCKTESVSADLLPMTSMAHPLRNVGSALLDMVLLRLERGGQDVPGVIQPVPFSIGMTTRAEENEILAKHSRQVLANAPSGAELLL